MPGLPAWRHRAGDSPFVGLFLPHSFVLKQFFKDSPCCPHLCLCFLAIPGQQGWFCNPLCLSLCASLFAQRPGRTEPGKEGRTDVEMNTSSVMAATSDAFSHTPAEISILFSPINAHYTCAQADHTNSFSSGH